MSFFNGTRRWVYPQSVTGRFQTTHRWIGRLQHLILFGVPLIYIGGHPAVRLDLPARRVYLLGSVFTATDTIFILLAALFAAFSLFFFTSLFGRLWCGYACPQTVFLEEWIRPIEKLTEGDRGVRMRTDKEGWSAQAVARKALKLTLFAGVAVLVSMGFMGYFAGAYELWTGAASVTEYTLVGIFAAGWFLDFAWFREQLCIYLCPYARFQGALTDDESLVVSYNVAKGEPRGGKLAKEEGHCIDCKKCVAVCPQGIDIRDGYQLECINCARCVDACEGVMGKLGHEPLVKYTTIAAEQGHQTRWIRPRTVTYGTLLTGLLLAATVLLATHEPFDVSVVRVPGSLYTVDPDGMVRNTYLLKVTNNHASGENTFHVATRGLPGAEYALEDIPLQALEARTVPLVIRAPPSASAQGAVRFEVVVTDEDGERAVKASFKGPTGKVAQVGG